MAGRIQTYAGFLVVSYAGEKDDVALDAGRIMAMPRGKERLIVACKDDEFPWLRQSRVGGPVGLTTTQKGVYRNGRPDQPSPSVDALMPAAPQHLVFTIRSMSTSQ